VRALDKVHPGTLGAIDRAEESGKLAALADSPYIFSKERTLKWLEESMLFGWDVLQGTLKGAGMEVELDRLFTLEIQILLSCRWHGLEVPEGSHLGVYLPQK